MNIAVSPAGAPAARAAATIPPWKQIALALALAAAGTYFVARGPLRAFRGGSVDFQYYFYIVQRTFVTGGNPYQMQDLLATAGAVSDAHRRFLQGLVAGWFGDNPAIIYPPGFFAIAPIGLLPVKIAVWVWMAAQCTGFAALLWWASRLASTAWTPYERLLFVACGLCLAPAQAGIAGGSTGPLFASLAVGLFWHLQKNSTEWAGLILGLLMMKPTFGIPAALVVAVLANWRVLALGFATWWLTSLPMFWRFGIRESLSNFFHSVLRQAAPGGPANETLQNPAHYTIVNLRAWLSSVLGPVSAAVLTAVTLALMLYALLRFRRRAQGGGSVLYWALAACFISLAAYHRSYDAAVIAVPLAAAFDIRPRSGSLFWLWVLALVPFAVPAGTFLHLRLGAISHRFPLLELLLIRHQTVALLALAALAVAGLRRLYPVAETFPVEV